MDYPDVDVFVGKIKRKSIEDVFLYLGSWVRIEYYDENYNKCSLVGVFRGVCIVGDSMGKGTFIVDGAQVRFDHDEKVRIELVNGL